MTGERKDHQRLEKLKAERQEKINELKEKTNYYNTQQLIQVGTSLCSWPVSALQLMMFLMSPVSGLGLILE